jgi:hypothetical protein
VPGRHEEREGILMITKKYKRNPKKVLQFLELLLKNLRGLRLFAVRKAFLQ